MASDARKRPRGARGEEPAAPKIYNRPSIFKHKEVRIQGMISKAGATKFEQARKRLADLAGWKPEKVSDADTIEYLARGDVVTKLYLKGEIK